MVVNKKNLWTILAIAGIIILGGGGGFIAWRLSQGESIIPSASEAGCSGCCFDYNTCQSHADCPTQSDWDRGYVCDCSRCSGGSREVKGGNRGVDTDGDGDHDVDVICHNPNGCLAEIEAVRNGDYEDGDVVAAEDVFAEGTGNASSQAAGDGTCNGTPLLVTRGNGTQTLVCDIGNGQSCTSGSDCTGSPGAGFMWSCYGTSRTSSGWVNECVAEPYSNGLYLASDGTWQDVDCDESACISGCSSGASTNTIRCDGCDQLFTCTCPGTTTTTTTVTTDTPNIPDTPPEVGTAWCVSLDDSETGNGRHIFNVVRGDAFSITLYTETATRSGGYISNYDYTAQNGGFDPGALVRISGSSATDEVDWGLTASETSGLSLGQNSGAFVVVTDNEGNSTGGDGSACSVDLYVTANEIPPGVPYWVLTKSASSVCINDDETAVIDYVITLANLGDTSGTISEVVDTLDSKITEDMISDITPTGTFDSVTNTITWDNGGAGYTIAGGSELQFTYRVTMDSADFGTYENTVSATPGDDSTAPDDATAEVDVTCELPETAIDDESLTTRLAITAGITLFILAFVEVSFGVFSRSFNYAETQFSQEQESKRRRNRFESKF